MRRVRAGTLLLPRMSTGRLAEPQEGLLDRDRGQRQIGMHEQQPIKEGKYTKQIVLACTSKHPIATQEHKMPEEKVDNKHHKQGGAIGGLSD